MKLKEWLRNFVYLFYPKLCINCSCSLFSNEEFLCLECYRKIPRTNYHLIKLNPAYNQFAGKIPIEKASSFLYYNKGGISQKIIASFKYRDNILAGKWISQLMVKEMKISGFFNNYDFIIPVPLYFSKKKQRGFNQTEIIGEIISQETGIPLNSYSLFRKKPSSTQTKKGIYERWENTSEIFDVKNKSDLIGKRILLIDDVLTTGATLEACASALLQCRNIKISILTLAIA